jgi:hypothetical protein
MLNQNLDMLPLLWKRVMLFFIFALVTFASGFDKGKVLAIAKRGLSITHHVIHSVLTLVDAIDFDILPFASVALESIEALYAPVSVPSGVKNATRIDVHCMFLRHVGKHSQLIDRNQHMLFQYGTVILFQ